MKRKTLSLMLIFVLSIFVLVGCGGNTVKTNKDGVMDTVPTDKIKIEFWHAMGKSNQAVIDKLIESFNKKYPNIEVVSAYQGSYTDLRENIIYGCAGGTGPTVAQTYQDHVAMYIHTYNARELTPYINHENPEIALSQEEQDQIFPSYLLEGSQYQKEGMYSLPFNKSSETLYYNRNFFIKHVDALKQYGVVISQKGFFLPANTLEAKGSDIYWTEEAKSSDAKKTLTIDEQEVEFTAVERITNVDWPNPTWEQVEGVANYFLTTQEAKDKIAELKKEYTETPDEDLVSGFAADSQANLFITLTQQYSNSSDSYTKLQNGEGVLTFSSNDSKVTKSKDALRWFVKGYKSGAFATATKFGEDYSSNAFAAGRCIMTLGSSAGSSYNIAADGSFQTNVTSYPQLASAYATTNPTKKFVIQQGTNVTLFKNKDLRVEMAGWLFIKHIISYEMALEWALNTSYYPIRKDVYESQEYQDYLNGITYVDGKQVQTEPTLGALTQKVVTSQREYMFTNVSFVGSSDVRDEAEQLVIAATKGGTAIDDAYALAVKNIKIKLGQ